MEYYLTTYTKDYKWPVKHSPCKARTLAENAGKMIQEQVKTEPCSAYLTQPTQEEPRIDPAQCGAPPAGPASKFDQPTTYLRKLYLKFPYLYQVLKLTSPEELAKIVYADKYVTTYNSDYQVKGFTPLKNWLAPEEATKSPTEAQQAGLEWPTEHKCSPEGHGAQPPQSDGDAKCNYSDARRDYGTSCGCVEKTKETVKAEAMKRMCKKPASISSIPRALPTTRKPIEEPKPRSEFTSGKSNMKGGHWRTEYRDTINQTGNIIIKKKLLSRPPAPCE